MLAETSSVIVLSTQLKHIEASVVRRIGTALQDDSEFRHMKVAHRDRESDDINFE